MYPRCERSHHTLHHIKPVLEPVYLKILPVPVLRHLPHPLRPLIRLHGLPQRLQRSLIPAARRAYPNKVHLRIVLTFQLAFKNFLFYCVHGDRVGGIDEDEDEGGFDAIGVDGPVDGFGLVHDSVFEEVVEHGVEGGGEIGGVVELDEFELGEEMEFLVLVGGERGGGGREEEVVV